MKTEEINQAACQLADAIAKGMAAMLWDRHMVTLTPEAQKDVGTLVLMNAPQIIELVNKCRKEK